MAESFQHKIDDVRTPRVHITYDVETNGSEPKRELPFVVGVLAALSGHREEKELGKLDKRNFVSIDRDNINEVMANAAPVLNLSVANTLSDDGSKMRVSLAFNHMKDFDPDKVAAQVPALKKLLDMRARLKEVQSRISTNAELGDLLQEVLANTAQVQEVAKEMGIETQPQGGK